MSQPAGGPASGAMRAQPSGRGNGGPLLGPGGLALVAWVAFAWSAWRAWRQFERVEVAGLSMAPTLEPGDHILVWKTKSVRPGDIVAASDPRRPGRAVLKRVIEVLPEGLFLRGDNPEHSTDSRHYGLVPITSVQGRAIYRYAPPARTGKLS
jgi:nickel-type superoxide dismutase maturation protease